MNKVLALIMGSAILVFLPEAARAGSLVVAIGAAQATLQIVPDPPQVGKNHAIVTLSGAPAEQLAHTTAGFGTLMPTMAMNGPSGTAKQTAPGRWEFDAMLGMAAAWDMKIQFNGSVSGAAVYHITVGGTKPLGSSDTPQSTGDSGGGPASDTGGVAGMNSSGDPSAWRTATFVLALILVAGLIAVIAVRRDRRPLTIGIVAGAMIVTVLLAVVQARYAAPAMDMAAMSSVQGEAPIPVTLAAIGSTAGDPDVFAPGSIAPYLTQDIVTRASGILRDFNVYAGDHVYAGQVIATLDAPDVQTAALAASADAAAQAAAAQAAQIEAHHHAPNGVVIAQTEIEAMKADLQAALADQNAKAETLRYWSNEVRREKALLDQGAVSQQEYEDEIAQAAGARAAADSARLKIASLNEQLVAARTKEMDAMASVEQMRAQANSAQAQSLRAGETAKTQAALASYTSVTSPSEAIVVKRLVDPGVYVQAGTVIARIAVVDRLRVQANVAQSDLAGITAGTPIDARLSDGTTVHGRVTSVSPVADPTTHTAAVEAVVVNRRPDLVAGGYVQVTLHARSAAVSGGFTVPSAAVIGSTDDAAVWTMSANKTAHRVPVRVIVDNGSTATVTGSLRDRTRVVIDGAATLEEGQPIAQQGS